MQSEWHSEITGTDIQFNYNTRHEVKLVNDKHKSREKLFPPCFLKHSLLQLSFRGLSMDVVFIRSLYMSLKASREVHKR